MRKEKLADTLCISFGLVEIIFPNAESYKDGFLQFLDSVEKESGSGIASAIEKDAELPELSGLKWTAHACTWHEFETKDGRKFRALECHGMKKSGRNTFVRGVTKCWGFKWSE